MAASDKNIKKDIEPTTGYVDPAILDIKPLKYLLEVDKIAQMWPNLDKKFVDRVSLQGALDLGRVMSLWPLTFGLACCAIEMMATGMARFDMSRFGFEVFRPSARQADVMIVAGTVSRKFAPAVKRLYEQMPAPKYVVALGNCAVSGGPFKFEGQYGIMEGVDQIVPVDVYVPGCPPRPEAILEALFAIQEKVTGRRWWKVPQEIES